MPLAEIEQLLEQVMGLHTSTVGSSTVSQAVERRMRACGISEPHDYLPVARSSQIELDALIDEVVIPETWFFRDRHPFSALQQWFASEWLPRRGGETLRILSIPCSTGEEPYTIAMTLRDAGLPAALVEIDAMDISRAALERAQRARYGDNSFRGQDLSFRDRYFVADRGRYVLSSEIRRMVRFQQGNLLQAGCLADRAPYHLVFCRNLLIYFDRLTQLQAIDQLEQTLSPDGLLFLGHSETSLLLERAFTPLVYPRCFGFRRTRQRPNTAAKANVLPRPWQRDGANSRATAQTPLQSAKRVWGRDNEAPPAAPAGAEELETAFELADRGHLVEAADICERLLAERPEADVFYLLGVVRKAAGNLTQAEELLRKALYLDPDHYCAITQLATVCDACGHRRQAQRLRQRAERALQRGKTEGVEP